MSKLKKFENKPKEEKEPKEKTTISISKPLMEDLRVLSWFRRGTNSDVIEEALKEHFKKAHSEIERAKEVLKK